MWEEPSLSKEGTLFVVSVSSDESNAVECTFHPPIDVMDDTENYCGFSCLAPYYLQVSLPSLSKRVNPLQEPSRALQFRTKLWGSKLGLCRAPEQRA